MIILMSAFIFPGQATTMISLVLTVIIPLLTVTVFAVVNATQPKTYDLLKGDWKLATAAGILTGFISTYTSSPPWLCIAASLAASSALYGSSVLVQMREIGMLEKALPQFLRDVTEYKKMGYDVTRAMLRIARENTYNQPFDGLLRMIARQLELGVRMIEIEIPVRSWLTRMAFFLLAEVVESGGGTARCLEILTNFVNQVVRVKRETRASMRLYEILATMTPVMLSFIIALMFTMITAFTGLLTPTAGVGFLGELTQIPKQLVETSYMLVIAASTCIPLLAGKTIDLTAKNTLRIAVNLALAAAGIAFSTQIAQILMHLTMGTIGLPQSQITGLSP
jgi:flagellar protein FlaJ